MNSLEKNLKIISEKISKYSVYDYEVIEFCLKLWLSTIFQSICMLIISAAVFDVYFFVVFFVSFFPLRLMFEGYHSKTFKGCFVVSNAIFLLICLCAALIPKNIINIRLTVLMIIISTVYFAGNIGKKISACQKWRRREIIYIVLRIVYVFAINLFLLICFYLKTNNIYIFVSAYSYCTVFLLAIAGRRCKNEE